MGYLINKQIKAIRDRQRAERHLYTYNFPGLKQPTQGTTETTITKTKTDKK